MTCGRMSTNPYHAYYTGQSGGALPVFRGRRYQRGHGLGNVLRGVARTVLPIVLPAMKQVGRQALRSGYGVVRDVMGGRNLKRSLQNRAMDAGKSLLNRAFDFTGRAIKRKMSEQSGRPAKARKRDRPSRAGTKRKKKAAPRRRRPGLARGDIFG